MILIDSIRTLGDLERYIHEMELTAEEFDFEPSYALEVKRRWAGIETAFFEDTQVSLRSALRRLIVTEIRELQRENHDYKLFGFSLFRPFKPGTPSSTELRAQELGKRTVTVLLAFRRWADQVIRAELSVGSARP